jgi:hypothetical protein
MPRRAPGQLPKYGANSVRGVASGAMRKHSPIQVGLTNAETGESQVRPAQLPLQSLKCKFDNWVSAGKLVPTHRNDADGASSRLTAAPSLAKEPTAMAASMVFRLPIRNFTSLMASNPEIRAGQQSAIRGQFVNDAVYHLPRTVASGEIQ